MAGSIFIKNWETTKKRWSAWWECDLYDRPVMKVTAPVANKKEDIVFDDPADRWFKIENLVKENVRKMENTIYGGEAVPYFETNWSVAFALPFGCQAQINEHTAWCEPLSPDESGYPKLEYDRNGEWYNWILENHKTACESSNNRYYVTAGMWGNHAGDILLSIRGSEELMIDIAENFDWVKSAIGTITDMQKEMFEKLMAMDHLTGLEGTMNYIGCWSPKRTLSFDCDVSCMVSPENYVELFLNPMLDIMEMIDHPIYHLDGPDALRHLDAILAVPKLKAVQWVPGAGKEEITQWYPAIRKIQEAKKAVIIYTTPEEAYQVLKDLSPEGLCICTECSSEEEMEKLLAYTNDLFKVTE
ncbi:MAG: hypothetical protein GX957_01390 [Clostridiaceae bacterium]|nr:hypothetical protein [Clostridiaceae bacterium]